MYFGIHSFLWGFPRHYFYPKIIATTVPRACVDMRLRSWCTLSSSPELHIPVQVWHRRYKIFNKRTIFVYLPILIKCVETCIHVTILLCVVSIKPICVGRHIATTNLLLTRLRLGLPRFSRLSKSWPTVQGIQHQGRN